MRLFLPLRNVPVATTAHLWLRVCILFSSRSEAPDFSAGALWQITKIRLPHNGSDRKASDQRRDRACGGRGVGVGGVYYSGATAGE